jgi:hypothetical protein
MLDKVFLDHPHSLGETYWQHQRRAMHFGISMITAGAACLVHALVPAVFVRTASSRVLSLYDEMSASRRLSGAADGRSLPRSRETLPAAYPSAARL